MSATKPVLTFEAPVLGRSVARLGRKIAASIEPFQRARGPQRWVHIHLNDHPRRTLKADNDNAARELLRDEVTEWCVGIGWLMPGERVDVRMEVADGR